MCGLAGVILGKKRRTRKELDALTETFIKLLVSSEYRGPHATGVAWVKNDGTMDMVKEPLNAWRFVKCNDFRDWLNGIDNKVTYLIGHTRWPSRGNVKNYNENHPIWTEPVLLTHNGTIHEHYLHYIRLKLKHTTRVDSELLARIAQRHASDGGINMVNFIRDIELLDGSISLAMVNVLKPNEIILMKGNMPLEVRFHKKKNVLIYASEAKILDWVMVGEDCWEEVVMAPGEALVVDINSICEPLRYQFTFEGMTVSCFAASKSFTGV
jgi:glucosamine 6-phosphate synthetase-like amidotransferase/phosphosugar isomerase protein